MTPELFQIAGSLGVGAFLGTLIFLMYRKDKQTTEKRIHDVHEAHSERLEHLLEQDQETRESNTRIMAEVLMLLKNINGKNRQQ